MRSIQKNKVKMCLEGGPKNEKISPQKLLHTICISNLMAFDGGGDQKVTKFVKLLQFYALSIFPCFIISDANLQVDYCTLAISEV